jgi:tRNA-2-methylthio-N6-dimethylallyladenosine synthase
MEDQVPKAVVQERFERLTALQDHISREENHRLIGTTVKVLVSAVEGRKASDTHRVSGRAEDSRLVHFEVTPGSEIPRPGDIVTVEVTDAGSFQLIADSTDGAPLRIRRTASGDAWDRAEAESCAVPAPSGSKPGSVSLGFPSLRVGPPPSVATIPIYDIHDGLR